MDFDEMRKALNNVTPIDGTSNVRMILKNRLPFNDLLAVLRDRDLNSAELAVVCGVDERTIAKWRTDGLTLRSADKVAVRLGYHPLIIWGDRYWLAN